MRPFVAACLLSALDGGRLVPVSGGALDVRQRDAVAMRLEPAPAP